LTRSPELCWLPERNSIRTRARVTRVMGLLRLAPEIQKQILSMPAAVRRPLISERMLRPIGTIKDNCDQIREFQRFLV